MAVPEGIDPDVWQGFLRLHHLGTQEQRDFGTYLVDHEAALPVDSIEDLEEEYLDFLAQGGSPDPT